MHDQHGCLVGRMGRTDLPTCGRVSFRPSRRQKTADLHSALRRTLHFGTTTAGSFMTSEAPDSQFIAQPVRDRPSPVRETVHVGLQGGK